MRRAVRSKMARNAYWNRTIRAGAEAAGITRRAGAGVVAGNSIPISEAIAAWTRQYRDDSIVSQRLPFADRA